MNLATKRMLETYIPYLLTCTGNEVFDNVVGELRLAGHTSATEVEIKSVLDELVSTGVIQCFRGHYAPAYKTEEELLYECEGLEEDDDWEEEMNEYLRLRNEGKIPNND